jgi:NAD(P)-dependent dehydrogenase (short-subunit alcohol dehydrogenase family)
MADVQTILVTGGSKGIGRATALALAREGRRIVLAARGAEELAHVADELRAQGADAVALPCDVRDEAQVRQLVARAAEPAGRIDVLVNSAGGAQIAPIAELSPEEWRRALDTLLSGVFLVCQAAMPYLPQGGLIVNVASVAARQAFPGWGAYSAAKAGLLAFTNVLREELRERGVRVTSVLPAATDTPLWDALPGEWSRANMLRAEDVARAIADLAALPAYAAVEELTVGHVAGRL